MSLVDQFEEQITQDLEKSLRKFVGSDVDLEEFDHVLNEIIEEAQEILEDYRETFESAFQVVGKSSPVDPTNMDRQKVNRAAAILLDVKFDELGELREIPSEKLQDQLWEDCEACNGEGTYRGLNTIEDPCGNCNGDGVLFGLEPTNDSLINADGESIFDVSSGHCVYTDAVISTTD